MDGMLKWVKKILYLRSYTFCSEPFSACQSNATVIQEATVGQFCEFRNVVLLSQWNHITVRAMNYGITETKAVL